MGKKRVVKRIPDRQYLREEISRNKKLLKKVRQEKKLNEFLERKRLKQEIKRHKELLKRIRMEKRLDKEANIELKDIKKDEHVKKEEIKKEEHAIRKIDAKLELEKKVEHLLEQGYEEDAILSALLALSHKERHVKAALMKAKGKNKEPKKEVLTDRESKVRTEVDDIYYTIKVEEKITISELANKLNMPPDRLRRWLEYLEKDGLITINCRFGGKEFVKIKEEF